MTMVKLTTLPKIDFQLANKDEFDSLFKNQATYFEYINAPFIGRNVEQKWTIVLINNHVFGVVEPKSI